MWGKVAGGDGGAWREGYAAKAESQMAHTEDVGLQQELGASRREVATWRADQGTQGYASSRRSIEHWHMETVESRPATEQRLASIVEPRKTRAGCLNPKLGRSTDRQAGRSELGQC